MSSGACTRTVSLCFSVFEDEFEVVKEGWVVRMISDEKTAWKKADDVRGGRGYFS